MSQETSVWLNQNTLIGFTDQRGHAWHYRASAQGAEPNHYSGPIPVEDVKRRLFYWEAVEADINVAVVNDDGVLTIKDPERKAIVRPDTGTIFGYFRGQPGQPEGYKIHQFTPWLVESVEAILDDELSIGSAGLLKGGAVAWVSVEVPDTLVTPEGVKFRPHLLACTAHDGSLASTWKRCVTNVVCDNTMSAALGEGGGTIRVKHSRYSTLKLQDAKDALGIVHSVADDFRAEVAELCAVNVPDAKWGKFLDAAIPLPDDKGRSRTLAENKREALQSLWDHDARVTPWRNTAFGVVQAVNTAAHHVWHVRGDRSERNMLRAIDGGIDKLDADTLSTLQTVLA